MIKILKPKIHKSKDKCVLIVGKDESHYAWVTINGKTIITQEFANDCIRSNTPTFFAKYKKIDLAWYHFENRSADLFVKEYPKNFKKTGYIIT